MASDQASVRNKSSKFASEADAGNHSFEQPIRSASLFRSSDLEAILPLLRNCPVRKLEAGEVLIAEGRPNQSLFVVLEGELSVRLSCAGCAPLAQLRAGEVVGELSTIDGQPTSAFAVANVNSTVLVIDEELMWILVNTSHAVATNLLYMLSQRLRSGNAIIFERSERLVQYQYHATVDALTGLFNRHWLSSMLPRQLHRSRTSEEPFCILMIDIDEFKHYNDSNGHVAGDAALGAVAVCLRDTLRPTDMAARYGGEEFIVLLPNCSGEHALTVAERLRAAVESTKINHTNGQSLPGVTISIGAAELAPEGTVEAFVSAADEALYRAKDSGRNRVCL
jgi:diguanylate cyclase (GGDEF)-like protein